MAKRVKQNWVKRHSVLLVSILLTCCIIGAFLFIWWNSQRYDKTERGFVESIEFISEGYAHPSTGHKVTMRLDNGDYLELANTMDEEDLHGLLVDDYVEFTWDSHWFEIKHFRLLERTREG